MVLTPCRVMPLLIHNMGRMGYWTVGMWPVITGVMRDMGSGTVTRNRSGRNDRGDGLISVSLGQARTQSSQL